MGKDLKGKELGKGLSQRKDGKYIARFTSVTGIRQQKLFQKLADGKKWIIDQKYLDEHRDINSTTNLTVKAWYDIWIDHKWKTVRPNTANKYEWCFERFINPAIGRLLLKDIKSIQCQKILNNMSEMSIGTIKEVKITLHNLFDYAVQNDLIFKNPINKTVTQNVGKPQDKKEALSIESQKKFLENVKGNAYENQYRLLLQTGLRTGELVGLKWSDVDFNNKTLTISRTMQFSYPNDNWIVGEPKTEAGKRVIPLTEEAIRILKDQQKRISKIKFRSMEWKDIIFLNRNGEPVKNNSYNLTIYKICKKAMLENFSMHVLRHTFATRCVEAGMKPKILQAILGHSTINVTMDIYVHATIDERVKEMEKIGQILAVI